MKAKNLAPLIVRYSQSYTAIITGKLTVSYTKTKVSFWQKFPGIKGALSEFVQQVKK